MFMVLKAYLNARVQTIDDAAVSTQSGEFLPA